MSGKFDLHFGRALAAAGSQLRVENVADTLSVETKSVIRRVLELAGPKEVVEIPEIRTIHHFSCSGGTLFTKCIASMPNTVVLNELNIHSPIPENRNETVKFTPSDMVALLRQGSRTVGTDLISKLLLQDLRIIRDELYKIGRALVVRDHSHSVFLYGERALPELTLFQQIRETFPMRSVITVRNPIDSYLSMKKLGWHNQMIPNSFEEYCRRYLIFLDAHQGVPTIKYEDFVKAPKTTMRSICNTLSLTYYKHFDEVYSSFKFSGESGRTGQKISRRTQRIGAQSVLLEGGDAFAELANRLAYETK